MAPQVTTIGFTQTSAENFFTRLQKAKVKRIDVRLRNTSQLAGFAKADDLAFFLKTFGIGYVHEPLFAPTDEMLTAYKHKTFDWDGYAARFTKLIASRPIERKFKPADFNGACLLCSEAKPHHCHRKLVCDYLNTKWDGALRVTHL
jgi:uncharacterized protein (DUF488 family)